MPDGTGARLPLIVVNGVEKGPGVGFFGAMHGDELEGVQAINRIARQLDPHKMKGTFFGIPVVNPAGFWARTRNNPVDNANMNRVFPGKSDGTISERIAYAIYQYIVPQIACFVDYHAWGSRMWAISVIHIRHYGHKQLFEKTKEIASICGFKYISIIPGGVPNGMLDDINANDPDNGIPYISTEMAGVGTGYTELEQNIQKCVRTGLNILKYFDIIPGEPEIPEPPQFIQGSTWPPPVAAASTVTRVGGWMVPHVSPWELVEKGQKLADLQDMFGNIVDSTHAPWDGVVSELSSYPVIPANSAPVKVYKFVNEDS
jgi:predicted deacylase